MSTNEAHDRERGATASIALRTSLRRAWMLLAFALALALALACATPPRWRADDDPTLSDAAQLFSAGGADGAFRELNVGEIPEIPVRTRLRPCCALGDQLEASLGPVPIPGYAVGNIRGRAELGRHYYDNGVVQLGSRPDAEGFVHSEENGLVYTCHGGFIDTAHVRDYADWTIFLAAAIARHLERGLDLELPDEGGRRRVVVAPVDARTIERRGRRALSIQLAQWLAFQLSLWHEIATWYGWSSVEGFPEKVSAFSPEDLYSNLLGARIAAAIASQRTARDELLYNRSVDQWFDRTLEYLGAVDVETGREAVASVDGLWWDSQRRLPDPALLMRRQIDAGPTQIPWLVPEDRAGPRLIAACGPYPEPFAIANPDRLDGAATSSMARLEIQVSEDLAAHEPFVELGRTISDRDFAVILEAIREQNRAAFGPESDRPN